MKLRIFLIYVFQIIFLKGYAQDFKLLKKSFYPLSDSVLFKNDSNNEFFQLLEIAAKKDIVAIGEVTHGTDEVSHFQTLMSQNLVVKYNFKTVILGEISLVESYNIYDFVVNGNGNFNQTIYPKHLKDFLYFLKDFNSKLPKENKIQVIGSDIDAPMALMNFAQKHFENTKDEDALANINDLKSLIGGLKYLTISDLSKTKYAVSEIIKKLNNQQNENVSSNFKNRLLKQAFNNFLLNTTENLNFEVFTQKRDNFIFQNFEWIKSFSNGKVVVINAHNFHINRKTINLELFGNHKTFGEQITEKYGNEYFCIGTEVQKGIFRSNLVLPEKIAEHKEKLGNIIASFSDAKFGYLLSDSITKTILNNEKLKITYGTSRNINKYMVFEGKSLIGDAFDAIFFIKNSHPFLFESDYFTLFVKLNKNLEAKIIENGFLKIYANYSSLEATNSSNFGIFLNDENKNLLQNYKGYLMNGIDNLKFQVPKQTKFISINLNIKDLSQFDLNEIIINDIPVSFKEVELYDWNNVGFKKVKNKNGFSVKKD